MCNYENAHVRTHNVLIAEMGCLRLTPQIALIARVASRARHPWVGTPVYIHRYIYVCEHSSSVRLLLSHSWGVPPVTLQTSQDLFVTLVDGILMNEGSRLKQRKTRMHKSKSLKLI